MTVWIAGSGRMGRDLGIALARRGFRVLWVSRDPERRATLERRLARDLRREDLDAASAGVHAPGEPDLPAPDAIWETIEESREAKRTLLASLAGRAPDALLLSNSSSMLPSDLHPRCLGAHVFYPVSLTGFAELVVPEGAEPRDADRARLLLAAAGLEVLEQRERNAFAVNRLLLDAQAACCRAVLEGALPAAVDEAAAAAWPGVAHLALMDAVGLDVVRASVAEYVARMSGEEAAALAPLVRLLDRLDQEGRRGRKNGQGLTCGDPLDGAAGPAPSGLTAEVQDAMLRACDRALARAELDRAGLAVALRGLFGVEYPRRAQGPE